MIEEPSKSILFFFNDTATTEIYTLSLHDALPIFDPQLDAVFIRTFERALEHARTVSPQAPFPGVPILVKDIALELEGYPDRKSTRLNSSHANISYAVFCLKKKQQYLLCSPCL